MLDLEKLEFSENTLSHFEFSNIVTTIENADYSTAQLLCEEKLKAGYLDIRIICYYIASEYFANNTSDLSNSLEYLLQILFEYQEKLTPKKEQQRTLEKSLNWLYIKLQDHFIYLDSIKKPAKFEQFEYEKIVGINNRILDKFSLEIISSTSKLHNYIKERIIIEKNKSDDTSTDDKNTKQEQLENFNVDNISDKNLKTSKWLVLLDKLELLKKLVADNKFIQAAILFKLLEEEINSFNPLEYFPEIFSNFHELCIDSQFEKLVEAIQANKELLAWNTLHMLAKADYKMLATQRIDEKLQSKSTVTNSNFQQLFKDETISSQQDQDVTATMDSHAMGEMPNYNTPYQD